VLLVATLSVIALLTFRSYGATYDEGFQRHVGQAFLRWYSSAFADRTALEPGETGNLFLYGGLFDGLAELAAMVSPGDPFEARHLVNVLFSLAAIAGAALLARRLGGPRAGFLGALLLATAPSWWGHGFANPKDVPFGAPYPWILLATLRSADALPRLATGRIAVAGLALGAALGVRPGGLTALVPVVAGAWAVRAAAAWRGAPPGNRAPLAVRAIAAFAAIVIVAWAGMLAAWPWGQVNPLSGPLAAAGEARRFSGSLVLRFAGEWHNSSNLPRSYAPTHLFLAAPDSWLVAAVIGSAAALAAWRAGRWRGTEVLDHALVAAAGLLPVAAAIALRPTMYDGMRHLLFILPALAALLASGVSSALARLPRWSARTALGVFAAACALVLHDMRALHPYEYVYFNWLLAGGVAKASARYETDYWGASYREGAQWLARNYPADAGRPIRVAVNAPAFLAAHWLERDPAGGERFTFDDSSGEDVLLTTTRWFGHRTPGEVLHVVERMGVPLLYVIDVCDTAGPLRLQAGTAAIELDAMPGWRVRREVRPGDRRARYAMTAPARETEAHVAISAGPAGEALAIDVLRRGVLEEASGTWGVDPRSLDAVPFAGPSSNGWVVSRSPELRRGGVQQFAIGAARVGRATVRFDASGDGHGVSALVAALATARLVEGAERRPP
jgi:hypothetical protein